MSHRRGCAGGRRVWKGSSHRHTPPSPGPWPRPLWQLRHLMRAPCPQRRGLCPYASQDHERGINVSWARCSRCPS